VITGIAQARWQNPRPSRARLGYTTWHSLLTTSITPRYIQENFEVSPLPEDAMLEIRDGITTRGPVQCGG